MLPLSPLNAAVMIAVPAVTEVTKPVELTIAMLLLDVVHKGVEMIWVVPSE